MTVVQDSSDPLRFEIELPTPQTYGVELARLKERYDYDDYSRASKKRTAKYQAIQMELADWVHANVVDCAPEMQSARSSDPAATWVIEGSWFSVTRIALTFKDRNAAMLFKLTYC